MISGNQEAVRAAAAFLGVLQQRSRQQELRVSLPWRSQSLEPSLRAAATSALVRVAASEQPGVTFDVAFQHSNSKVVFGDVSW